MTENHHPFAYRVAWIYAIVAGLWIAGSDYVLRLLFSDLPGYQRLQTYKGWAFVIVTAGLLYVSIRHQLSRRAKELEASRKVEAELGEKRERLAMAVSAGNVGFWDHDLVADQHYYSPDWKALLGYSDDEVPNRPEEWEKRVHPDDRESVRDSIAEYLAHPAGRWQHEYRMRHKDGTYRWIWAQGMVVNDASGKPVRMTGTQVDVTARRQVAQALQQRAAMHARLEHVASVVPGAIVSFRRQADGALAVLYASPATENTLGVSRERLAADARCLQEFVHPDDWPKLLGALEQAERELGQFRCEHRYRHPKRGDVWLDAIAVPERQSDGAVVWNGIVMDVTERKRAELRIHQLNRVYALLSETNQAIVRARGPQALFEAVCRIAHEQGGFELAWIGQVDEAGDKIRRIAWAGSPDGCLEPDTISLQVGADSKAAPARAVATGENVVANDIAADPLVPGRERALKLGYRAAAAIPIRVHGRVAAVLNLYSAEPGIFDGPERQLLKELAMDLSFALEACEHEAGRLRAEANVREREERFRQLAENIREVFWLIDPVSKHLLYISPGAEILSGRSFADPRLDPSEWLTAVHRDDQARMAQAFAELDREHELEFRLLRPDGSTRWVRARSFPVRDESGRIYRIAGVAEDITERKQLEQQFFRAQRIGAIGSLASGIAHDLNNILAPIMMCAPMLRMGLPAADSERLLGTIEASTRRGADLVRQLLVFGRGSEGGHGVISAGNLVLEMAKMATETFPKNIAVHVQVPDGLWSVVGDPTQLHQVLLNLSVNARDAMEAGGVLTMGAENVAVDAKRVAPHPRAQPGRYVRFRVSDTGVGITQEHVEKIFDPFFTTKPVGKGTGLGLSTVLGIAKGHGGFVELDTVAGRGSTFDVYIPAEPETTAAAGPQTHTPAWQAHQQLVLLVEDEVSIRTVVSDLLARRNYRVMIAEDGVEGETLFRENVSDIAMIITDLDMPRMDGMRFIESVRKVRPDVPIVVSTGLLTGRGSGDRVAALEALGVTTILSKPFGAEETMAALQAALGAPPAGQ